MTVQIERKLIDLIKNAQHAWSLSSNYISANMEKYISRVANIKILSLYSFFYQILTMIQTCLIRVCKTISFKYLSLKIKLPPLFHLFFTYFSFVSILYESWQIDIPMLMCTLEWRSLLIFIQNGGLPAISNKYLKLTLVYHQIFRNDNLHLLLKFIFKIK